MRVRACECAGGLWQAAAEWPVLLRCAATTQRALCAAPTRVNARVCAGRPPWTRARSTPPTLGTSPPVGLVVHGTTLVHAGCVCAPYQHHCPPHTTATRCAGDVWYFPPNVPHSILGLGAAGCTFVAGYNAGDFDELKAFSASSWLATVPVDTLGQVRGAPWGLLAALPHAPRQLRAPQPRCPQNSHTNRTATRPSASRCHRRSSCLTASAPARSSRRSCRSASWQP